jgi:hypothetical protein
VVLTKKEERFLAHRTQVAASGRHRHRAGLVRARLAGGAKRVEMEFTRELEADLVKAVLPPNLSEKVDFVVLSKSPWWEFSTFAKAEREERRRKEAPPMLPLDNTGHKDAD